MSPPNRRSVSSARNVIDQRARFCARYLGSCDDVSEIEAALVISNAGFGIVVSKIARASASVAIEAGASDFCQKCAA